MFGYLNLNDPTKIGENESQEAKNLRLDRGYLEYQEYPVNDLINRRGRDINGLEVVIVKGLLVTPTISPRSEDGLLVRKIGDRFDVVGSPDVRTLAGFSFSNPSVQSVAEPFSPTFTRRYYYAITIYNPETNEESEPFFLDREALPGERIRFTDFPGLINGTPTNPNAFIEKKDAEYRIYRRPMGGSEYLRTFYEEEIPAYNDNSTEYIDTYTDFALGEPCPTASPLSIAPFYITNMARTSLFTIHSNRLWFRQDKRGNRGIAARPSDPDGEASVLFYSKPYVYGEIPIDNWFAFNSPIVSLHSIDEALVVLCREDVFVIYGDSDKDFVVKQATDSNIGGVGGFASASIGNALCFLASDKTDRSKGNGLFMTVGGLIRRVSFQVDKLFPVAPYESGVPFDVFGAGSVDDRFFVVRYAGGQRLVYDILSQGFLQGSDGNTFSYRSKEFGRPGLWDDMRRAFVRGVGDFKLELYYDGIKEDEIEFSIPGAMPMTEDFAVPGLRANYFSYRFIGQQNAKIFEFGRLE